MKLRNRSNMKNTDVADNVPSDNDSLSDIEVCQIIGNVGDNEDQGDAGKGERSGSKKSKNKERRKSNRSGCKRVEINGCVGTTESVHGVELTCESVKCSAVGYDEETQQLCEGKQKSSKEIGNLVEQSDSSTLINEEISPYLESSNEIVGDVTVVEKSDATCVENVEITNYVQCNGDEHSEGVGDLNTILFESEKSQFLDNVNEDNNNEILITEVSGHGKELDHSESSSAVTDNNYNKKYKVVEYKNGEIDSLVSDGQGPEEAFTGEEENKENMRTDGTVTVLNSTTNEDNKMENVNISSGSVWEVDESVKDEFYTADDNSQESTCVVESDVVIDETDASDYDKSLSLTDGVKNDECDFCDESKASDNIMEIQAEEETVQGGRDSLLRIEDAEKGDLDNGFGNKRKRFLNGESADNLIKKRKEANEEEELSKQSNYGNECEETTADLIKENVDNATEANNAVHCTNTIEESINKIATGHISLPFIESLRGSIRSLSRNDLEELIVQKLCEAITERSVVGELRKKAQTLEQDQERWKEKVQALKKQIKEMNMVMKKYLSEVQKQNKERNFQVAPLRVTRSVGLQVSFSTNNMKGNKALVTNGNQGKINATHNQEKSAKMPLQHSVNPSPNAKKNIAILPATPAKKPTVEQKQQEQFFQRPGINITFQARLVTPQTWTGSNLQGQVNTANRAKAPNVDQNNTKIIDLTEDDDKQTSQSTQSSVFQPSVTVRPPSQIRVVNHIQPAQVNASSRVAYLVPATTAGAASSSSSTPHSRQLLIATSAIQQPARHILPSVPPLLYKGSTILQPGVQQPALINETNRTMVSKPLKHPAPLPPPPLHQVQKPSWKLLPPRPALKISKVQTGIVLSWNMTLGPEYEQIASYQLYAYQENNCPPTTSLWKKVGDVKALPLPMACTLTQFMSGHKYYFAVRAVDLHSRIGPFSLPGSIVLIK